MPTSGASDRRREKNWNPTREIPRSYAREGVRYLFCIEAVGWICPLTPLENALRQHAGEAGYAGGFIEHYIIALLYPPGLTRNIQFVLTGIVVIVNIAVYAILLQRWRMPEKGRL